MPNQTQDGCSVVGECEMPIQGTNIKPAESEQRHEKLMKKRNYARVTRQNESAEHRADRLLKQRAYAAAKRKSESVSEKKIDLIRNKNIN